MKIDDIAKLANVSKGAVSLALNGKKGVSEKTREKILKIASEHGYITRSTVSTSSPSEEPKLLRLVACTNGEIVTEHYESLPFFMELIGDINKQISSNGYSLIVSTVNSEDLENEITQLEKNQQSAGILLLGTNLNAQQIKLIANIKPNLVVLDTCFETLAIDFVLINNTYGAYEAGKYLAELGHKNIGYVESEVRIYNFDMRKKGFLQAMDEYQLAVKPSHFFSISPMTLTSQEAFKHLISNRINDLPTALFCEADYMAISVIKSLTELGIKVPEEVSVIGFDDIFESQAIIPELTTIHVKKDVLASMAVKKLIQDIDAEKSDKIKLFVDTEVVVRNSCRAIHEKN